MNLRVATVSVDLDNLWAYLKAAGKSDWKKYPSYLELVVPTLLALFAKWEIAATFFLVGDDLIRNEEQVFWKILTKRGHEISNHSMHHDFGHRSIDEARSDLLKAHESIANITGIQPVGFRAPGFTSDPKMQQVLVEEGYLYDASLLPTWLAPLLRKSFVKRSQNARQENGLYGSFWAGFYSNKNSVCSYGKGKKLVEMPVTTIPLLKVPFHMSYLHYLGSYSKACMKGYLETALFLCKLTNTEPNFLFHPTDLLGADRVPDLRFFPGMDLPSEEKLARCNEVLSSLQTEFTLLPMREQAKRILSHETT